MHQCLYLKEKCHKCVVTSAPLWNNPSLTYMLNEFYPHNCTSCNTQCSNLADRHNSVDNSYQVPGIIPPSKRDGGRLLSALTRLPLRKPISQHDTMTLLSTRTTKVREYPEDVNCFDQGSHQYLHSKTTR